MKCSQNKISGLIGTAALATGLLAACGSAHASLNLVVNGSFESGSFTDNTGQNTDNLSVGSTAMTGWTVTTAALAWIGPSNPFGLTAADGQYFLDLSGYHDNVPYAGVAATSFATTVGQQYVVSFALGSDSTYNTQSPELQVKVNGDVADTATAGPVAGVNNRWETFSFDFTATSGSTTLEFDGAGPDNQKYVGLDNVNVSAVPEASTMIAGTLLLLVFVPGAFRTLRKTRAV
jgi:Protein of unknown function (DUF642)